MQRERIYGDGLRLLSRVDVGAARGTTNGHCQPLYRISFPMLLLQVAQQYCPRAKCATRGIPGVGQVPGQHVRTHAPSSGCANATEKPLYLLPSPSLPSSLPLACLLSRPYPDHPLPSTDPLAFPPPPFPPLSALARFSRSVGRGRLSWLKVWGGGEAGRGGGGAGG